MTCSVESLVPDRGPGIGWTKFLRDFAAMTAGCCERVARQPRRPGRVLRYVGRLNRKDGAAVRLEMLPDGAPVRAHEPHRQHRALPTARYSANPLVVQGPGAGPVVTAAGVFADLLRLASYLGPAR